jgi:hypothetical protein
MALVLLLNIRDDSRLVVGPDAPGADPIECVVGHRGDGAQDMSDIRPVVGAPGLHPGG